MVTCKVKYKTISQTRKSVPGQHKPPQRMLLPSGEHRRRNTAAVCDPNQEPKADWLVAGPLSMALRKTSPESVHTLLKARDALQIVILRPIPSLLYHKEIHNLQKTSDCHPNLRSSSAGHDQPLNKMSSKSVHIFWSYPTNRQTDRPCHITSNVFGGGKNSENPWA